ncbi:MAG: DUF2510 domain-containing protein [Actinomycetia bacterium]|nr:DUF2510 domain-containing protein [Actinomycetes bacterium]
MSDQGIPPGWYPNPENPAEERYWAGYMWTEHIRPAGHAGFGSGLRSVVDTLGQSFKQMGAHWRAYAGVLLIVGIPLVIVSALLITVFINSASTDLVDLISGEISADTDLDTLDISFDNLSRLLAYGVPLALVGFVINTILTVALYHQAYWQLAGAPPRIGESVRHGVQRAPRVMGVALQITAILVATAIILTLFQLISPALALIGILVLIPGAFLAMVVVSLSWLVASIGPEVPSLKTGWALTRGSFWAILGRILVAALIMFLIGLGTSGAMASTATLPAVLAFPLAAVIWVLAQAVQNLLMVIVLVIIYFDLGGPIAGREPDRGPLEGPTGPTL